MAGGSLMRGTSSVRRRSDDLAPRSSGVSVPATDDDHQGRPGREQGPRRGLGDGVDRQRPSQTVGERGIGRALGVDVVAADEDRVVTAGELQRQLTENSTQLAAREFDLSQHQTALAELQNQFAQLRTATTTERLTCEQRLAQLDEAARRLQASRSWRWTAWLRAIERPWGGR
ncbi:MAG: hypothetical protein WCP53_08415 [Verrucomicrobiota bacterium]